MSELSELIVDAKKYKDRQEGLLAYLDNHKVYTIKNLENHGSKLGGSSLFGYDYFKLLSDVREQKVVNEVLSAKVVGKPKETKKKRVKTKEVISDDSD